jgi:hypothetical protein
MTHASDDFTRNAEYVRDTGIFRDDFRDFNNTDKIKETRQVFNGFFKAVLYTVVL